MKTNFRFSAASAVLAPVVAVIVLGGYLAAQEPKKTLFPEPKFRRLVEGVERSINPARSDLELSSRHDVTEVVAFDPGFEWAKDKVFRHDVWSYELTFKPVRFIKVDLPGEGGKVERKLIWYMVYRIRNPGTVRRVKPTVYEEKPQYGEHELKVLGDWRVDPTKKDYIDGESETISEDQFMQEL
ncbi:MAG: hypothetical protein N2C14_10435, partial [Planctomycetales bacterium]